VFVCLALKQSKGVDFLLASEPNSVLQLCSPIRPACINTEAYPQSQIFVLKQYMCSLEAAKNPLKYVQEVLLYHTETVRRYQTTL